MSNDSEGISVIKHVHNGVTHYYGSASTTAVLLESKFMDFAQFVENAGTVDKCITGLRAEIGEDVNLFSVNMYVGVKARLHDEPAWYGPYNLEQFDEVIHTLDVPDARYIAFRLQDLFPRSVWNMTALEVFGELHAGRQ